MYAGSAEPRVQKQTGVTVRLEVILAFVVPISLIVTVQRVTAWSILAILLYIEYSTSRSQPEHINTLQKKKESILLSRVNNWQLKCCGCILLKCCGCILVYCFNIVQHRDENFWSNSGDTQEVSMMCAFFLHETTDVVGMLRLFLPHLMSNVKLANI